MKHLFTLASIIFIVSCSPSKNQDQNDTTNQKILFKNVNLIKGDGSPATKTDVYVENGKVAETGNGLTKDGATTVDLEGKTMMPAIISTHVHVGVVKDTTASGKNY